MRVTVADIVAWSGATLEGGRDATVIEGATADSRDITPGCLFVGVTGENVDGGLHAADAIAQGAAAVIVGPEAWSEVGDDLARSDAAVLLAADPVEALGRIGRGALDRLGARVQIRQSTKGKGQLVIDYTSLDVLDGILAHLRGGSDY